MKMLNLTKLTLTALIAANMVGAQVANAATDVNHQRKYSEVLKTNKIEGIQDPYFQLEKMKVQEISDEEALEFNNSNITTNKVMKRNLIDTLENPVDKGFAGPNIPNVPPIPPTVGAGDNSPAGGIANPGNVPVSTGTDNVPTPTTNGGVLDSVIMVIDKLIAIGQKIIPTIKEGKSVVTNNPMSSVSVLPRTDLKDFVVHDMGGWSIPVSKHYKITFTNGFGIEVVSFVYSISFQYNGQFNGKGKYLAGIRASARSIDIAWGFDLDATSQLLQISNVGTQDNVVAGATLEMTYTVKNWTRNITTSTSFHVTGEGKIYKLD